MNKHKGKTLVWSTAVLTMLLLSTACSGGNKPASDASPSPSPTQSASPSAAAPAVSSPAASPSSSASQDAKSAEGQFNGMVDGHSIEIKVDGASETYQVDPDAANKVSPWDSGTKVKFQYKDGADGQKVITSIDKA